MALTTDVITVADTATLIATIPSIWGNVLLTNLDASVTLYIGPSTVTTADGKSILPGESFGDNFAPGDDIYGIVASGTIEVDYIMGVSL